MLLEITRLFCALIAGTWLAVAAEAPLPMAPITAIAFSMESGGSATLSNPEGKALAVSVKLAGGAVVAGDGGFDWTVLADQPFGAGRLDILLERAGIAGDLAMILNANIGPETSLALQLFDSEGKGLALDLFGDLGKKAEEAGTDTFVIPLTRYPEAKTLVIRRLSGPLLVREVLLMPVISADTGAGLDAERDLSRALGEQVSKQHPLAVESGLKLHVIPSLEEINQVGASALAAAGYPKYRRIITTAGEVCHAPVSGTVYDFAQLANRHLSLGENQEVFKWFFTSSNGVEWHFENDPTEYNLNNGHPAKTQFGMGSVPLSEKAKAAFEKRQGYPVIEFPIARNAIEVIVNHSNPLAEISMEGLRAAFGEPGAPTWSAISPDSPMADERVIGIGGSHSWGTGKVFQEIVLLGGPWRSDMLTGHDVVYAGGVEEEVAKMRGAIGYAVQRERDAGVKKLKIESSDGSGTSLATADAIYSGRYPLQRKLYAYVAAPNLAKASPAVREMVNLLLSDEGQTMMVRSGSLPLAADELLESRKRLGLDD